VFGPPRFSEVLLAFGPLLLLGFAAGAIRAYSQREGLSRTARRALGAAWVLLLLVGGPLWLFLAATLRS
jgi:hypothetical protein